MKKIIGIFLLTLSMNMHSVHDLTKQTAWAQLSKQEQQARKELSKKEAKKKAEELNKKETVIRWETRNLMLAWCGCAALQISTAPFLFGAAQVANDAISTYFNSTR